MSEKQVLTIRNQYIIKNRMFKTNKQLAEDLGVTERTIDRDIRKMKNTGSYWDWAHYGFLDVFREGDVDDSTKLRELNKIQLKEITDKHQVETKGDVTINVVFDKRMDDDGDTDTIHPP